MGLSPSMYKDVGDFSPLSTDVIIIGGGATGAGIARDCALRGIDCILKKTVFCAKLRVIA